jgi:drug/metabolite transporter (DMT)-like permease
MLGHVAYQMGFILGIDRTLAGNAALFLATGPVWTVLLAAALERTWPGPAPAVGAGATFAGVSLVVLGRGGPVGLDRDTLAGDALILLAAVLWAAYTVAAARLIRTYGPLRVTAWSLWLGTPFLVVAGLPALLATPWGGVGTWAWAGVGYAGALAIGVAYVLWNRGIQRLGHVRTAVYQNLVPVAALLVAWIALGEVPTGPQLLGAAVILGGVALARRRGRGAQTPGPSSLR